MRLPHRCAEGQINRVCREHINRPRLPKIAPPRLRRFAAAAWRCVQRKRGAAAGLVCALCLFFFLPACTRLSDVVRERGGCSTNRKGGSRWPSTVSSIRGASVCESHSSSPSAAPASISPRNVHKWAAAMNNVSFIISAAARLLFFFREIKKKQAHCFVNSFESLCTGRLVDGSLSCCYS